MLSRLVLLLAIPLVSLIALWGVATGVTVSDGLALRNGMRQTTRLSPPSDALIAELQRERWQSVLLVTQRGRSTGPLRTQRAATDQAVARFRRESTDESGALGARVRATLAALGQLPAQRTLVDQRLLSRLGAAGPYTTAIDRVVELLRTAYAGADADRARRGAARVDLTQAVELQDQEAVILAGAMVGGRFVGLELPRFAGLVQTQRFLFARAVDGLPADDRREYDALRTGPAAVAVHDLEDRVLSGGRTGARPPVTPTAWGAASRDLSAATTKFSGDVATRFDDANRPHARWVVARIVLTGGLGLLGIVLTVFFSVRIARSLARELIAVRRDAQALATTQLPDVVQQVRDGNRVDVTAPAGSHAEYTVTEIRGVAVALDAARTTALAVAVEEATLRRGVREVFVNLAQRTQSLVHRQLTLLDAMERRESHPDALEDLFKLDHLATRMRRHAEDLIILSGESPGRGWRQPVPMVDVLRGATAEVEDYARVRVVGAPDCALAGRAVGDVIHLLAELIENATAFSPPHTSVQVSGQPVPHGFAIQIEDRGLGIDAERRAVANARLADPPEFDLLNSDRLGLFVVAQLAARHGVKVTLNESPYGGTTAVVLLPPDTIVDGAVPIERPALLTAQRREALTGAAGTGSGEGLLSLRPVPSLPAAPLPSETKALPARPSPLDPLGPLGTPPPGAARRDPFVPTASFGLPAAGVSFGQPAGGESFGQPAAGEASRAVEPTESDTTSSGLPRRFPQANLAAPLRDDDPRAHSDAPITTPGDTQDAQDTDGPAERTPDEIRTLMSAYQRGSREGRAEAEAGETTTPGSDDAKPEGETDRMIVAEMADVVGAAAEVRLNQPDTVVTSGTPPFADGTDGAPTDPPFAVQGSGAATRREPNSVLEASDEHH